MVAGTGKDQRHYHQVRYGGCNHTGILSETQLRTGAKGQQLNPETLAKEDLHMCNACLNGEPGCNTINGEDDRTVLRPIVSARKLSPLEVFQIGAIEKKGA